MYTLSAYLYLVVPAVYTLSAYLYLEVLVNSNM